MGKLEVLDFYGEWCGPCKMMEPIIDQLKEQYKESDLVSIEKIDVDKMPELSTEYGIRTVPTILFIRDGIILDRINGATNKKNILSKLEEFTLSV